ncbi:MAG TPA: APC family permease, partial [Planctomycetota bacterium]|nr:APC family permease [Planctomycetota bacterium]
KLVPLAVFLGGGILFAGGGAKLDLGGGEGRWAAAILALMFAFGGFEAALIPMGEAKDPRRDVPVALFGGLLVVAAIYLGVHLAVAAALPDSASYGTPAVQERPVAEAARVILGPAGAALIAAGVMLSTGGYLAGQFVSAPRLTFALAERGDFPRFLAAVHPRFATPHASIVLHGVLVATFAIQGSFLWNAVLSAVARLVTYGVVCGAVPRLRRRYQGPAGFRVAGGPILPILGLGFCVWLAAEMTAQHALIAGAIVLVATANWAWVRRRG